MRFVGMAAVLGILAWLTPASARAQDLSVLQLQQRLIAERRLADDREVRLLREHSTQRDNLQSQLATARRSGSAGRALVASLTAKLKAATAKEEELVAVILKRDPVSRILVGDLETELAQLSSVAAPAARRALEQFANGDRAGAWTKFEALSRSGGARDKRLAARMRMIMFNYQDPGVTAADVRDRWKGAVDADPGNGLAWLGLAAAEQYLGDVQAALAALEEASRRSTSAEERHLIAWQRSWAASVLQDPNLMISAMTDQLAAIRALVGSSIPAVSRRWMEQQALVSLGNYRLNNGESAAALTNYREAAKIIEELEREAPNSRYLKDALAATLMSAAFVEANLNKLDEAAATYERASALLEERIRNVPADAAAARTSLVNASSSLCNIRQQQTRFAEAVPYCLKTLENMRKFPKSAAMDYAIASNAVPFARLLMSLRRNDEARPILQEAVDILRRLITIQDSASLLASYAETLHELATIEPDICWRDVVSAWAAAAEKTPLPQPQQRAYLRARSHESREKNCPGSAQSHRSMTGWKTTTQLTS